MSLRTYPPYQALCVAFGQDAAKTRHYGGHEAGRRSFRVHLELLCIMDIDQGFPALVHAIAKARDTLYPDGTYKYAYGLPNLLKRAHDHLVDESERVQKRHRVTESVPAGVSEAQGRTTEPDPYMQTR